jgi:hypothetical protein
MSTTAPAPAATATDAQAGPAVAGETGLRHARRVAATVMLGHDFDVVVIPPAVRLLVFDAQIGKMDLVIEVRKVVFASPLANLVLAPIRFVVGVSPPSVARMQPRLIVALELVVEDDSTDVCTALSQPLCCPFIGAVHLDVVFPLALAFEAVPQCLAVALLAVSVLFQETAACLGQRDPVLTRTGQPGGLDEPLVAEVPEVACARAERSIPAIAKITTGDHRSCDPA